MDLPIKYKSSKAFTIVELAIAVAIFGIISTGLVAIFTSGIQLVRSNQFTVAAVNVANEKIEVIKNLPYSEVGTIGGIPSGSIPQTATETLNGREFTITTSIRYIDDAYDDVAPTDTVNTDYKQVRLQVSWEDSSDPDPVTLTANISPNGLETTEGGGTLWIEVYDPLTESIDPVADATVTIEAPDVTPAVSITSTTDENGRYILIGAPPGIEAYHVTITKDGYSTAQTYDRDPVTNPNPLPAHLNVVEGQVTTEYFQISPLVDSLTVRFQEDDDKVTLCHIQSGAETTITVSTNSVDTHIVNHGDYLGPCNGDYDHTKDGVATTFLIHGEKSIGTDLEGLPIYKYSQTLTTNTSGEVTISDFESDTYHIIYDEEAEDYVITAHSLALPMILLPSTVSYITFDLAPYEEYTALLNIVDHDGLPLTDATVHVYDGASYDQTQYSYHYGQVFFSGLFPTSYSIEISQDGYDTYTGTLIIAGNENQTLTLSETL